MTATEKPDDDMTTGKVLTIPTTDLKDTGTTMMIACRQRVVMREALARSIMAIEISNNRSPDIEKLIHLFKQAGWRDKLDSKRVTLMVENSTIVVTAWDNMEMVGFARCTTDYTFNGQINNVIVDKKYKGQGIGKKLISKILESSDKVTYILRADPDNIDFYKKIGFEIADLAVIYKRKR